MSVEKTLGRVGIVLSVAAMAAIGQTKSVESVKIGDQTWTKQNVNIKTLDSWCYKNNKSNCAKYGRLYTWEAAKAVCANMGGGWRLPDTADWRKLVAYADSASTAGKRLKSRSGWNDYQGRNGNGTDDYGFSALPGGYSDYRSGFSHVGNNGSWWSATDGGGGSAYFRYMYYYDNVGERSNDQSFGFSVRCVAR